MIVDDDFLLLNIDKDASPDEVRRAWRSMATRLHPDHGGDAGEFAYTRDAYRRAYQYASRTRPCKLCHGRGVCVVRNGFHTASLRCKSCNGSGKIVTK